MRIMIMSQYYPPNYTAAGTRVYEMAKYFAARDEISRIDIVVWNPLFNRKKPIPQHPKVEVHEIQIGKHSQLLLKYQDPNPIYASVWLGLTAKFCKEKNPDIVIFSTPPGVMLAGTVWCRISGIKYAIDYRDNWVAVNENIIGQHGIVARIVATPLHRLSHLIAKCANKRAAFISTVHHSITDFLGVDRKRIVEVRNGIDVNKVKRVKPDDSNWFGKDSKYIAYVGNLSTPYYSPEILIPALRKNRNYKLLVFSTSSSLRFIRAVKKAGLKSQISIIEAERDKLLSVLKRCDAGLLIFQKNDPQGSYAIPSKFYDYISCGLPVLVVADRTSYVHRFIKKHGNGIALDWSEKKRIYKTLAALLDNPDYRKNAAKIVPMVLETFDRERQISRFLKKLWEIHG